MIFFPLLTVICNFSCASSTLIFCNGNKIHNTSLLGDVPTEGFKANQIMTLFKKRHHFLFHSYNVTFFSIYQAKRYGNIYIYLYKYTNVQKFRCSKIFLLKKLKSARTQ